MSVNLADRELGSIAIPGRRTRRNTPLHWNRVERRKSGDGLFDPPALAVQLMLARSADQRATTAAFGDPTIDRPIDGSLQCPLKRGLRFSTKAAVPSGAS